MLSGLDIKSKKPIEGVKSPSKKGKKKKGGNSSSFCSNDSTSPMQKNIHPSASEQCKYFMIDGTIKTEYSDSSVPDSSPSRLNNVKFRTKQKKKLPLKKESEFLNVDEVRVVLTDCESQNKLVNIKTEPYDENIENECVAITSENSKGKNQKLNKKKRIRKKSEKTEDDSKISVVKSEDNIDPNEVSALNYKKQLIISSEKKKRKVSKVASLHVNSCSTQNESIGESSLNKEPTKQRRGGKKFSKKVKGTCNKPAKDGTHYSASNLDVDIGVLDIGAGVMDDEAISDNMSYIPVDSYEFHGILLLSQNQKIAMKGSMQLYVVYGVVDVSGYKLVPGKPYVDVFSVTTSSLFYLQDETHHVCNMEMKDQLISVLASMLDHTKENVTELISNVQNVYSCLAVKKLNTVLPAVLMKLNNFRGFTKEPQFLPQPFKTGVLETNCWKALLTNVQHAMDFAKNDCTCSMMFCGAANVGKSSFARYAINRMLEKHESVFFLDCDCGQSEFTPPSVLSLVKVTKPLIGLPFSHQITPVRSFFYGHISPSDTPAEYIKLIGTLFQTYYVDYYAQGPLVVNTQGWMQGLGLSLLVDVIRMTSPCHIFHIFGHNAKNNVPEELNSNFLEKIKGWDTDMNYKCMKKGHGCTFHNLSTTDTQKTFKQGNKSRITRDQCISSYFSPLYQKYLDSSFANGESFANWIPPAMSLIKPFMVKWKDVALYVMHEKVTPDVMLFGFNLTLVGLARVDPDLIGDVDEYSLSPRYLKSRPVAEHIGFGIIRNINQDKKLFYILTPEPVERLKNVNALLRGGAQLPTSYFLEDIESNQPYYCSDYINVATKTAGGMKPRYNLKRKPSKMRNSME